jgi:hypothetical protein
MNIYSTLRLLDLIIRMEKLDKICDNKIPYPIPQSVENII